MSLYSLSSDDFALVAATAKTVIRFNAGAGRKAILREVTINDSLAGATDQGLKFRVLTAGTDGTGTAFTPVPLGDASASNGTAKVVYTAEPTTPTEVYVDGMPAGSKITKRFDGAEGIRVAASGAIALEITGAQARSSGVVAASIVIEEI